MTAQQKQARKALRGAFAPMSTDELAQQERVRRLEQGQGPVQGRVQEHTLSATRKRWTRAERRHVAKCAKLARRRNRA